MASFCNTYLSFSRPIIQGKMYFLMRRKKGRAQQGSILTEMAVVLPLFLVLGSVLIDMGIILRSQISIARLAYEGARLASDTSRLPVGSYTFNEGPPADGVDAEHLRLRDKILKVAEAYNIQGQILQIATSRNQADKSVRIALSMKPHLIFFGSSFPNFSISAESNGPYLFLDPVSSGGT
jgi:hypothetical protein